MNEFQNNDQSLQSDGQHPENSGAGSSRPDERSRQDGYWTDSGQQQNTGRSGSFGQEYPQRPPYSPQYPSNNVYPPRQGGGSGYNQSYGSGGNGRDPYQQYGSNPYQYSPNSGWQQPAQEKYEWKFEDYDKLDNNKDRKKRNRGVVVFTVSLLCVLSFGLVGLAGYSIYTAYMAPAVDESVDGDESGMSDDNVIIEEQENGDSGASVQSESSQLQIAGRPEVADVAPTVDGKLSIPEVAKLVSPSVVGVIMYTNNQYYEIGGLGSGIIMSEDGYIITNAHVVEGGTNYKVQLHNGDPFDADLVGSDAMTDLAVLKIDTSGLVPAQFGDSEDLEVGETVVAIGNPAGLELSGSVTRGIVSAVNREVRTTNYSMNYIQTDAAINPGNSGGALANEFGQVIGINSSKIVASGYEGIGFAIPITNAKPIIDDIINNGKVTGRVMLGITCQAIDDVDARNYGIERGLSIDSIDPASDLASAGVLRGDILTHIDGERVLNLSDVRKVLDDREAGDTVTLTMYRRLANREMTYEVETRLLESQ